MNITTVYFVRHAQSDRNVHDDRTRPLTSEGKADSERAADLLKDRHIDLIMSSPYKRSMDTVSSLTRLKGLEIITDEDFRERNAGSWLGDDFIKFIQRQWEDHNFHIPDGECLADVQKRNISALKRVLEKHSGKTVVIATHGTALSTIINYYNPEFGFEDFMRIIDFMPYVVKMEFEEEKFLGMTEELIIKKSW